MQSVDSIETCTYGMDKVLVSEKEEIKYKNIINNTKVIKFDNVKNEKKIDHNP